MMSLVSFCCKTWTPFHAWSKNILELRKLFPMSLSKWIIQTIQELSHLLHAPTTGAKAPNPLVRAQMCHAGPLQPLELQGSCSPWVPEHRRVPTPPGKPQISGWKQPEGIRLSAHEWVWSGTFLWLQKLHWDYSGSIFTLWKAQQTFIAPCKQKIPCWMPFCTSKPKTPWPWQTSSNDRQR